MNPLITDHLATWTTAPNGIKKLRELILELAVRGLLVPQDANDEPASVLLKKIAKEKTQLITEGKIKKQNPLPKISEQEKPFALPNRWEWVRISTFTQIGTGSTPSRGNPLYYSPAEISWVTSGETQQDFIFETRQKISALAIKETNVSVYPIGSLIVAMYGQGKTRGQVSELMVEAGTNQACAVIQFIEQSEAHRKYIKLFYKKAYEELRSNSAGGAQPNLNVGKISLTVIPLPPLSEQHRIVAKVDELMQLCDQLEQKQSGNQQTHRQLVSTLLTTLTEATDAQAFQATWSHIAANFDCLFTTEESIEQLKQTILQLAVMGKLVPQDPNDEPASELLKKIATEKARLISEDKIKKTKLFPKILEQEKPFNLPKTWEWVRLGELVNVMDAGWSPACIASASPSSDVWGVLKTTSVQIMEYLEDKNKELPQKLEPKMQYEVKVGDILITRAGPENRVGIACSVQKTRPKLMISDKIIRFSLVKVGISEQFISLSLNTGATAEFLKRVKSGMAASQMNISQDNLSLAPIPLPPLTEQHRIVAKVDELMTLCEQLKTKLATAQALQQQLAETLVQQAVA